MNTFQEGDIVRYQSDDGKMDEARVRRVYENQLQLINSGRGYQLVSTELVEAISGQTSEISLSFGEETTA